MVKFAQEMSVEQAEAEKGQRGEVVRRGRFEVWKVSTGPGQEAGERFVFRVSERGVEIEKGEG